MQSQKNCLKPANDTYIRLQYSNWVNGKEGRIGSRKVFWLASYPLSSAILASIKLDREIFYFFFSFVRENCLCVRVLRLLCTG